MRMRCMSCDARACMQAGRGREMHADNMPGRRLCLRVTTLSSHPLSLQHDKGHLHAAGDARLLPGRASAPAQVISNKQAISNKTPVIACLLGSRWATGVRLRTAPAPMAWHGMACTAGACGCTGSACHTAVQRCIWQAGSAQTFSNLRFIGCAAHCDRPHIRTVSSVRTSHRCVRVHSQRQAWH